MQVRQATTKQKYYTIENNNVTKILKILLEILSLLLLLSKNKELLNNILRVQEFAIVKLKNCLQNLLNKI